MNDLRDRRVTSLEERVTTLEDAIREAVLLLAMLGDADAALEHLMRVVREEDLDAA